MAREALSRRDAAALLVAGLAFAPSARAIDINRSNAAASRLSEPAYTPPVNIAAVNDLYRRMTAPVRINGQGPFPFVVDTGSNQTVIAAELAAQLGLSLGDPSPLNGVAGVQMAPTTQVGLDVGPHRRRDATVSILAQADIGGLGLLGLEDLDGQAVTLDFRGRALRIEPGRRSVNDIGAIAVKAHRRNGQLTLVDADIAGLHVTAFLDSGAQNTIGNMALRAMAITRNPAHAWYKTPIVSATGQTILAEMADLPRLRVGDLNMPNWPVAFADLHTFRMWNLVDRPAILLGVDVLSRFETVCLDFARDEVRFRLPGAA
ncbi:MAG TPA: aspartyl protease family protein [Caulobacteraceae bacterium]|nr:aspartyl protease family protein [Caulobacteraceae bacterium]